MINALDEERLALAKALGVETHSFWQFLATAYGVTEGGHVERIVQGYGRQAFPEPDSLTHRYFTEDIPFGLVTWNSLANQIRTAPSAHGGLHSDQRNPLRCRLRNHGPHGACAGPGRRQRCAGIKTAFLDGVSPSESLVTGCIRSA